LLLAGAAAWARMAPARQRVLLAIVVVWGAVAIVQAALLTGSWRTAETLWRRCLALDRDNGIAAYQLAQERGIQGHADESLLLLRQAASHFPFFAQGQEQLAALWLLRGDPWQARCAAMRTLMLDGSRSAALLTLAEAELRLGRTAKVLAHIGALPPALEQSPRARYLLGAACRRLHHPGEAERYLREAVTADPRYAEAWLELAALYRETGDAAQAETASRRAAAATGAPR